MGYLEGSQSSNRVLFLFLLDFCCLRVEPKARVVLFTFFGICKRSGKMVNVLKGVLIEWLVTALTVFCCVNVYLSL